MTIDQTLQKIERSQYFQRLLMMALILTLVGFLAVMFFFSDIRHLYEGEMTSFNFSAMIVSLILLSVIFVTYIAVKDQSLKMIRQALLENKVAAVVLETECHKLETLLQVSSLVNSNLDRQKVFDAICTGIVNCLKADQSSLMLHQEESRSLRCVSCYGHHASLILNEEVKLGEGIAGWVAQTQAPLLLEKDISRYNFIKLAEKNRTITSSISVPLILGGKVKGILNVNIIDREDKRFDENDLRIVKIFAQNAVLAMERAYLHAVLKNTENLISLAMAQEPGP